MKEISQARKDEIQDAVANGFEMEINKILNKVKSKVTQDLELTTIELHYLVNLTFGVEVTE